MAALRRKTELGRFLKHQYNAQLNRRTQEIQEELEVDGRILQALLEKEGELQQVELARREQARADAAWMKQVIEEQLQLEKAREAELQQLLREEAKEMWEKREAEWAREQVARDRLMSEVIPKSMLVFFSPHCAFDWEHSHQLVISDNTHSHSVLLHRRAGSLGSAASSGAASVRAAGNIAAKSLPPVR